MADTNTKGEKMYNDTWDAFFGNPILSAYIEEAEEAAQQEQEQGQEQSQEGGGTDPEELSKLAADLKEGHLTQDDLIDMYKAGKLSQDDIKGIIAEVEGGEGQEGDPGAEQPDGQEPQTEEELLAQQLDQTNDMFIKFTLYDKIIDLNEKLNYFKENFEDTKSDLFINVEQLSEFLNILSNLVFNIETAVAYQMYGSLLLQLTELFKQYNDEVLPQKRLEDSKKDQKQRLIDKDQINISDEEKWADENKSYLNKDQDIGQDHGQGQQ